MVRNRIDLSSKRLQQRPRTGNLRPGDVILRVGEVSTRGLSPDQVARLIRQSVVSNYTLSGASADTTSSTSSTSTATTNTANTNISSALPVSLLVARPAQGSPTTLAAVFEEQSRQVKARQPLGPLCIVPTETLDESVDCLADLMLPLPSLTPTTPKTPPEVPLETMPPSNEEKRAETSILSPVLQVEDAVRGGESTEDSVEFSVLLRKPSGAQNCSLGLTIVGYVSEKDKDRAVTGIYVKDVLPNGLASISGKIKQHDQIIKVNGIDLKTLSNKAAAHLLKTAGPVVHLTFLRHTSGRVCEQLKQLVSSSTLRSRTRQTSATLPGGFRRRPQRHRSRRKYTTTGSKSHGALCIPRKTLKPLRACPVQSELLVTPQVNSEDSEDSSDFIRDLLGPSTCQSLPMLSAASLMEATSTVSTSSSSVSINGNIEELQQTPTPSGLQEEQTTSSAAASMTLYSSPLDEMDEIELSSSTESPVRTRPSMAIGRFELNQLRAAVHYERLNEAECETALGQKVYSRYAEGLESYRHDPEAGPPGRAGRITPELVKLMVDVWTPIVGLGKDILVIRVVRPKNLRQLGISLIGSTLDAAKANPPTSATHPAQQRESEDGGELETAASAKSPAEISSEVSSRHFVHTVLPGGLFSNLDCLKPGDELLQVNGYRLHGHSHVEVVRCLRCLPAHIELVIARLPECVDTNGTGVGDGDGASTLLDDTLNDSGTILHVAASEIGSVATAMDDADSSWTGPSPVALPSHPPDLKISEWIGRSQSDGPLHELKSSSPKDPNLLSLESTAASSSVSSVIGAFPPVSALLRDEHVALKPTWSTVPLIVMLRRDKPNFGFSISVYDEGMGSDRSTVRRSSTLKRSGSLSRRRTVAGDLNHSGGGRFATISRSSSLSPDTTPHRGSFLIINSISRGSCVDLDGRINVGDRLLFVNDRKLTRATLGEAANTLHNAPLGYTMIGVAKMTLVPNSPPLTVASSPQFTALVSNPDDPGTMQLVARRLVDEVLEYTGEVKAIVEEVVSSALVEYLQNFVKMSLEGLVEVTAPVETVEVLITSSSVLYLASTCEFPVVMVVTQGVELAECDRDYEDDDYSSLESIDTFLEQSELSQSSEDWLASLEFVRDTEEEFAKEHVKDHPLDYYTPLVLDVEEVPFHAAALVVPEMNPNDEKIVRVKTHNLPLGCELDALAAGGVDGCRVVKVLRGGAVEKAAALVPGDYITRINSDNLRRVTNAEAFRILRKASMECNTIEIGYYPGEKVITHRIKHVRPKSLSAETESSPYFQVNGSGASSTLIVDLPPPELIITTEPLTWLLSEDPPQKSGWLQTRELKLLKLPGEDTWGLSITGPDVWQNNESPSTVPSLPPEVSQPVFVSDVAANTAAGRCGLLERGDIIIGVNGMDATRVGCRTVAEWIQTANLVSSSSSASSDDNESLETAEWAFLYLLVLPLHSSSSPSAGRPIIDLQSIPPVALGTDSSAPSGDRDGRPPSFICNTGTLVRSAFVSSNDSSMEEPTSVASLELHGDLPEPLGISNLAISPPTAPVQMPPLPPPPKGEEEMPIDSQTSPPLPKLTVATPNLPPPPPPPSPVLRQPIPSVQTIESRSAWRNIGSSCLSASLVTVYSGGVTKPHRNILFIAQLTQTYRRPALADDEIHVVAITLTPPISTLGGEGPPGSEFNEGSSADCETGLGVRLVGHRDTNSRGVFVCSLREGSLADRTSGLQVTDEIVQVNNVCVMGLTHVSAKLLIAKEVELARRGGSDGSGNVPKIFLVIRHNVAYNASVMAKPASGTAPTGCGHFLHHYALRSSSQPCISKATPQSSKRVEYEFLDVTIERNAQGGLGLFLVNMNPRGDLGVFVQSLLPTSPAGILGQVQSWDRIVAINGEPVQEYDAALAKLTTCHPSAHLRLARAKPTSDCATLEGEVAGQSTPATVELPRSFSPHSPPTPILPGVETTVEIIHSAPDLGCSVIGGSDTHMGGVFIEKIHQGGTVYRDGRLRSGDRILAVNGIDLRQATHAAATKALREAKEHLFLTVLRGSRAVPFSLNEIMQTYSVALQKRPGNTFGLVLADYHSGGVVISEIAAGSSASQASVLHPGDVILEVDGLDVHKASSQDVMTLLKQSPNHILLKTGRLKPPRGQPIPRLRLFTVLLTRPLTASAQKDLDVSVSAPVLRVLKRQTVPSRLNATIPNIFGMVLRLVTTGEGIYVPGNLVIESIAPESAASRCGMLQIGDRLLGIDREPVGWLSLDDLQRFSHHFDSLTFEVGRLPPPPPPSASTLRASTSVSPLPSPQPPLYSSGLAPLKEGEEATAATFMKPISVDVEGDTTQILEGAPSPVRRSPVGFKAIEDGDDDEDEDEMCSNNKILQIQLLPPSADSAQPSLGLTLASARGACGGQRVVSLDPTSPAAVSGLQVGDRIIGLDDRLLLALGGGGRNSESVLHAIESAWHLRRPPSDIAPLTLTIVRPIPLSLNAPLPINNKPRSHFPVFPAVVGATAAGVGLIAGHQLRNPPNRRLPRDVGDNLDVQLQAGPPGLLVPAIAAGVATGVYRGAVDDYLGQPYYNNGPAIVDPIPLIPSGTSGQIYNDTADVGGGAGGYADGDDEEVLPPPAHYLEDNYDSNGKLGDGDLGAGKGCFKEGPGQFPYTAINSNDDDDVVEGEYFYDDPLSYYHHRERGADANDICVVSDNFGADSLDVTD
ncbi:Multiple PDZ domain protein [Echinococcus granulosus]|uniref:Multiple PDZ domain protein n=1 Tax=Echinococcus granulosus TaxID=6210 RepID=W6UJK6_ECHGR|nr:Multiple PDZ domain protein [Echinococcus granulosus]EUB61705.1 Multiple PDZ domain protein [Echinococcus granulosus]